MRRKSEEFLRKKDFSEMVDEDIDPNSESAGSSLLTNLGKQELTEKALNWFLEKDLVNDLDYALSYIEEQKRKKEPKGPLYVRNFLRKKGISAQNCEEALEKSYSEEAEKEIVDKILAHMSGSKQAKDLFSMLQRRGFRYQTISGLIDLDSKKT